MCLKLMKLKPEDEVIIPNVTFIATATPLVWLELKLYYVMLIKIT